MIRAVFALVIAGLTAAVLVLPAPEAPASGTPAAIDPPPVSICPIEEGSGLATTVGVASTVNGEGQLTAFAGGDSAGSASFATGASGAAVIPLADIAAVGVAAGLVELPNAEAASGSIVLGAESVALESCLTTPAPQTLLAGGSTASGQEFEVILMNPYSGEARVELTVSSESGLESLDQLQSIAVPSRSSFVLDMHEILPGRDTLSVTVDTSSGSVMIVGRVTSGADSAMWNALAPAQDWFVPIPSGGTGQVVVATGVGADVAYQIDLYGPDGLVEAFEEGVVPARGQAIIDAGVAGVGASAMRVVSTQPVAVFLRNVTESVVAVTSGSTIASSRWLLPGAGQGPAASGRMVILNAGLEEANVVVTALREESVAEQFPVSAGTVFEFPAIDGGALAYTLRAEGSMVPLWVTTAGSAVAYSLGVPILDE